MVLVELAVSHQSQRRIRCPVLLAGDEAQTVRPTDFEWGWLNDLLHARVGTPAEYKLKSNLRSPRRIAELVNRVWDLYAHLEKQRPAERNRLRGNRRRRHRSDSYCTAAPGPELDELLTCYPRAKAWR